MLLTPAIPHLKRKTFTIAFQFLIIPGSVALFFLSVSDFLGASNSLAQSLVSICWVGTFNNFQFALYFIYIAEIFPSEILGVCCSIVFLIAKVLSSAAPYIGKLSQIMGGHLINGLILIYVLSIPAAFFLPETLGLSEKEKEKEIYRSRTQSKVLDINNV